MPGIIDEIDKLISDLRNGVSECWTFFKTTIGSAVGGLEKLGSQIILMATGIAEIFLGSGDIVMWISQHFAWVGLFGSLFLGLVGMSYLIKAVKSGPPIIVASAEQARGLFP